MVMRVMRARAGKGAVATLERRWCSANRQYRKQAASGYSQDQHKNCRCRCWCTRRSMWACASRGAGVQWQRQEGLGVLS